MNKHLRALQDKLQALVTEARGLDGKEELSAEDIQRAESLATEIGNTQAEIKSVRNLSSVATDADSFLNQPSANPIAAQPGGFDPEAKMAKMRQSRTKAKYFGLINDGNREAAKEQAYRAGMFVLAAAGNKRAARYCSEHGIDLQAVAHEEGSNELGGVLVPVELETSMIDLREQFGVFRQYARYTPMASDTKQRFKREGGLEAVFIDEGEEFDESNKKWSRVGLTARKLGVLARYTNEFGDDAAISVGDDFVGEISYAFALKEDKCGFMGDGTKPYGRIKGIAQRLIDTFTVSGGPGLIEATGNLWSEFTLADFQKVTGALPQYAEPGAAWFCHKMFWETTMARIALESGGVPAAEIVAGVTRRFLGYPVVITQVMPRADANSQIPVFLGNMGMGVDFGDRLGTSIAISEHSAFRSDAVEVRGIERFDINFHSPDGKDEDDDSQIAGPVVGLISKGS